MTKSRIKPLILSTLLALLLAVPVEAQQPADASGTGRDASFLPPPSFDTPSPSVPIPAPTSNINPAPAPAAVSAPLPVTVPAPSAPQPPTPPAIVSPPALIAPVTAVTPVSPPEPISQPVEEKKLGAIDPESVGLFSNDQGGLGAAMWKGTARDLVEQILPDLILPSNSPVLNNLAQRLLLTTADVPAGKPRRAESLIAMRVNALIQLGDAQDAWKLIGLAKPEQIDDATLHDAVEVMLVTNQNADVCARLPDIIKERPKADWQEPLLVCQLLAKDAKAAQLTLDLMHSQNVKDDTFFYLAERNVMAGAKELPRQLTPLKPLTLALLQQIDLPLRSEVYAHPGAALIPAMLPMKTKDDNIRLSFAERVAERGIITATDLEAVYASIVFPPEAFTNAVNSTEAGARLHALLYQAAVKQETTPEARTALSVKFLQGSTAAGLNGVLTRVLADMIGTVHPAETNNTISASVAHIYIMANNPQIALEWLKQARHAAIGMPGVAAELQSLWPLAVLTGLETDSDYASNLGKWLDAALTSSNPKDDPRILRERAGSVLLILDAAGFAVPEDDWARVINSPVAERHIVPPPVLLERLRAAGAAGKRGEAVLLSLLLSGGNQDEQPILSTLEIIRALRQTGLTADASLLAREAAALILFPPPGKP